MILNRLTVVNLGVYRGRHTFDLRPQGNGPIILFGGKNGAGKTTLMLRNNALRRWKTNWPNLGQKRRASWFGLGTSAHRWRMWNSTLPCKKPRLRGPVEHYFLHASHQVILYSTDTEVDAALYTALQSRISHAYHLEYYQAQKATRVSSGYFWCVNGNEGE